jgi:stage II sporulation SpoE-like protein
VSRGQHRDKVEGSETATAKGRSKQPTAATTPAAGSPGSRHVAGVGGGAGSGSGLGGHRQVSAGGERQGTGGEHQGTGGERESTGGEHPSTGGEHPSTGGEHQSAGHASQQTAGHRGWKPSGSVEQDVLATLGAAQKKVSGRGGDRVTKPRGRHTTGGKGGKSLAPPKASKPPASSAPPKVSKPPAPSPSVSLPAASKPKTTVVSAPLSGVAGPTASTAVATAVPPTQPAGLVLPAVSANSPQVERRAGRARAHSTLRHPGPAVLSPGTLAPVASVALTSARAAGTHRAGSAGGGSHDPPARGRPSPLVTTITRIVGVVPTPLWILVGALLALALALAVRSRFSGLRARRLERQRSQLLEDVGLLQAALLPVLPARLGPVGTSAAYRPADGPGAGGDFYDVFGLEDGQLGLILGDISGHGRQALPHTALVRFTLRAYLEAGLSPRAALQTAGAVLEHQLGGSFATVAVATYEPRERILTYACAGHPAPVMRGSLPGSEAAVAITACSAPPIGVGMRTGTRQTLVSVPGRSQVCFYTDGVTEARVGPELFGVERLASTLAELGPETSASGLLDRVAEQVDRRPDDMAACLLNVEGGVADPRVLVEELEFEHDQTAADRSERFLLACGVERAEAGEVIDSARRAAGRSGTVVIEVHLDGGSPRVALQHDNVSLLHARRARPQTPVTVSR